MTPIKQPELRFFSSDWRASCREAVLLFLLAVTATAVTWALRVDRLPLAADRDFYEVEAPAPLVGIPRALVLFDEGDRLFIDTRPDRTREKTTIPGAFLIRASSFDDDLYELADTVYPEDPVILFGDGDLRGVTHVADLLVSRGFEDVLIMRDSMAAWRDQGGEISSPGADPLSDPEEGS